MANQKVSGRRYKSFGVKTSFTTLSRIFLGKRGGNLGRIIGFGEHKKDIFSEREVAGHVTHMGEERGVYTVLLGKPEGRRSLGRPRRRWVDNIRMYLQEVGCGYMDWIGLAQDRDRWRTLVSAVMNLQVP